MFSKERIVVFCDGDFWHGRNLTERLAKLSRGHNASYWVAKIERNAARDRLQTKALQAGGWTVLRFWETDILRDVARIADRVCCVLTAARKRNYTGGRSASITQASSKQPATP